ncbi:hypothetical protein B0T10DRAFT_461685 [Thelonectria olida]|uniref:Uncharacterized protein n=1 Tax=Thelonectria olida TaxID=1576542 RepID=A0A9P8VZP6_9HYPO|nr:hypothetical protein B0T10DRAFT_461685 [Thelonectria olida]
MPLRNLKPRSHRSYNLGALFYDEFFRQETDGHDMASTLWDTPKNIGDRVLFILDRLDELSQELDSSSDMSRFLTHLLNQPNVVITSRLYGILPGVSNHWTWNSKLLDSARIRSITILRRRSRRSLRRPMRLNTS